jgi:hypothetical protein
MRTRETVILEAEMAILLDLEKPFLLSNTRLYISRRLLDLVM